MSRIRDIAAILGRTEERNTDNKALVDSATSRSISLVASGGGGGGSGVTSYDSISDLPTAALGNEGNLGYITSDNKLYVSIGTTWAPVATVNASPTLSLSPEGIIRLSRLGSTTTVTLTATDADSGATLTYSATTDNDFDGLATISQSSNVFTITPKNSSDATTTTGKVTFSVTDGQAISSSQQTYTLSFTTAGAGYQNLTSTSLGTMGATVNQAFGGSFASVDRVRGIYVTGLVEENAYTTDHGGLSFSRRDTGGTYNFVTNGKFDNPGLACDSSRTDADYTKFHNMKWFGQYTATGGYRIFVGSGNATSHNVYPFMFKISDSDNELPAVDPSGDHTCDSSVIRFVKSFEEDYTTQFEGVTSNTYGTPIACDSSGRHIIIGHPLADNTVSNAGAVEYVYRHLNDSIEHRQLIQSPGPTTNYYFGKFVEMQPDGMRMAICEHGTAAPGSYGTGMGQVVTYTRDSQGDTQWTVEAQVQPSVQDLIDNHNRYTSGIYNAPDFTNAGTAIGMQFGQSIALNDDGTVMAVGAPNLRIQNTASNTTAHGGVWVFTRSGSTWSLRDLLLFADWGHHADGTWDDPGTANKDIPASLLGDQQVAKNGLKLGQNVGISPDGTIVVAGAPTSGMYASTNGSGIVQSTAEFGNVFVWTRDSDAGHYKRAAWDQGPRSSAYAFGRTSLGYLPGKFDFLSNTGFAGNPDYSSTTYPIKLYDSA